MKLLKRRKHFMLFAALLVTLSLLVTACGGGAGEQDVKKETITFADAGWDSIRLHNEIAQKIIEVGYGYKTDVIPGSTPSTFNGLKNGDIDVYMEIWTDNISEYQSAVENGDIVEVSVNFDDNRQGLYVPTYVIKGDAARGIDPIAPDLKAVQDLPQYWQLFKDQEDPKKGRIYGAVPGWEADEKLATKVKTYGLDENYNYFSPGSDTALATSLVAAYEKGEPWVGYYWEPTWITGKLDLTLLEDEPYSDEKWRDNYQCEFPPQRVTVGVAKELPNQAADVVEFLKHYQTSSQITSEALAYMQDNEATSEQVAIWFLQTYEGIWTKWVPQQVADKVKAAL